YSVKPQTEASAVPNERKASQAKAIFDEAAEIDSTDERAAYLDRACAGDEALRRQVDTLLRALSEAGSFLEAPPEYSASASPVTGEHESPPSVAGSMHLSDLPPTTGIAASDATGASALPQQPGSLLSLPAVEAPGSHIGPYKLLQRIGE